MAMTTIRPRHVIPLMAAAHGGLDVGGFALLAVFAWRRAAS